jgi:competence protein ComEA
MIRHFITALLAAFALNAFAAVEANQASRADLETVKGIGPGLSAKIIQARESSSFKGWGDLVDRVGGIGSGNAAKLSQAGLTVAGASFDTSAVTTAQEPKKSAKPRTAKREKAPKTASISGN